MRPSPEPRTSGLLMRAMRWLHAAAIWLAIAGAGPFAMAAEPSGDSLPQVTGLRFGIDGARTRVVLAIDRRLSFGATVESDPERLVVTLPRLLWNPQPDPLGRPRGLARDHRFDA